jgi:hypothetical protein
MTFGLVGLAEVEDILAFTKLKVAAQLFSLI